MEGGRKGEKDEGREGRGVVTGGRAGRERGGENKEDGRAKRM